MSVQFTIKNLNIKDIISDSSFTLHKGQWNILSGQNGAGKTTLIKALVGLQPYSGCIESTQHNPVIRYLPQYINSRIPRLITTYDLLYSTFSIYRRQYNDIECSKILATQFNLFGMKNIMHRPCSLLSAGQMALVRIMQITLDDDVDLLLLDEPFSYIDSYNIRNAISCLKQIYGNKDCTILVSTHKIKELDNICNQFLHLQNMQIHSCNSYTCTEEEESVHRNTS